MTTDTAPHRAGYPPRAFRHEALLYAGDAEFVAATARFVRDGLEADDPVVVVVGAPKIDLLRSELGDAARDVEFADMAAVGANPARIIPAWREYVAARPGAPRLRGIGEPIWAGRRPAELVEAQHHEALLNLAFLDTPALWLLCPYDVDVLDRTVVLEAYRSHPHVARDGRSWTSERYEDLDRLADRFDEPMPEPPPATCPVAFASGDLAFVRRVVAVEADRAGLDPQERADLTLAVSEVAANSLCHGGGRGVLRTWRDDDTLICEVRDGGLLDEPLAGRVQPTGLQLNGRGLWLANQLCDLVQLRTATDGTVVRLHLRSRR
jgi:anti-sigma regulatory factor (Ser/Thr protein kinase)